MSDIKLFHLSKGTAKEIHGTASPLEKPLQNLIEANLAPLLGIRFLASEYSTGKTHAGRIDTLGLDENESPVIIEYKCSSHENIINQGLFYLDWLMDHRAEFKLLVLEKFGKATADAIDWSEPRLICIAADFTKYDSHAVQQMDRNIELLRYRQFGNELLLVELVNATGTSGPTNRKLKTKVRGGTTAPATDLLEKLPPHLAEVFYTLENYLNTLGDDVQRKDLKRYIAFKRLRNFLTACFHRNSLLLYLHLDPGRVHLVNGFTRDVRGIGHWGTGQLEVTLRSREDLEQAIPLIDQAYNGGSDEA